VLLDLPPGTGKTSFVYKTLIPEALARGKNLLLVSNRVALSSQQKRAVMEQLQSPLLKILTDEGVRQTEDFGPVRVVTYHRLPALLKDQNSAAWRANLAFAIFDEAHFFAADSLFCAEAEYCLRLASERFCHAVRIYMTGTSWDILEPLAEAEEAFYHRHTFYLQWTPPRVCFRYTIPADYSRFRLRWFSELDDLKNPIMEQPEERWLIFADNKERGRHFAQDLGSCAAYLDADHKGSDLWNRIVREERFDRQVLVATPVLDAGINIVDPSSETSPS
jgi:superfamily II DNA or RNA helicase